MAIVLFTDFGASDLYAGQLEIVLGQLAPHERIVHLFHEAPAFRVPAAAHLLAALVNRVPGEHVFVTVVDPGVGTSRAGLIAAIDGHRFVGPDNGLLSVVWERGRDRRAWHIDRIPAEASVSFHGRDVFAPVAGLLATGRFDDVPLSAVAAPDVLLPGGDLEEVIWIDRYGNAITGIRGAGLGPDRQLSIGKATVPHARVFGEALPGRPFWYVNSLGLAEVAIPGESAAAALALRVGLPVRWVP